MKTMKKNSEIIRVPEEKVKNFLNMGYNYCPKDEWKKNVRDSDKPAKDNPKKGNKN